jgi:hypothetical protein
MKFYQAMIDPELDREGRWAEFVPGMRFRIARMDNKRALDSHRQRLADEQARVGRAKIAPEVLGEIALETLARHVLLGWDGVDDADGKPIPYSPEKALEFLRDERCRDLRRFLEEAASDAAAYHASARKDAEGNSRSA